MTIEEMFRYDLEKFNEAKSIHQAQIKAYNDAESEIDRKIAKLMKKKENIADRRTSLQAPTLLPQVIGLLNEAIAGRHIQFQLNGWRTSYCVTPDMAHSDRYTTVFFIFKYDADDNLCLVFNPDGHKPGINMYSDEYINGGTLTPVTSIQMLVDHIDRVERINPPVQMTEDELIAKIKWFPAAINDAPQSLWTYRTITAALQGGCNHIEAGRIPPEVVDKAMFLLGLEHDIYFYDLLSQTVLESFGAYDEEFLIRQIRQYNVNAENIPVEKMTSDILLQVMDNLTHWVIRDYIVKFNVLLNQQIADAAFRVSPAIFETLPDKFKTYEMASVIYRDYKTYRKHIPQRFLTSKGRLKSRKAVID